MKCKQELKLENYKKFKEITFTLPKDILLITGKRGTGKTQLLWAIILYCKGRSFNFQKNSSLNLNNQASVLFHPSFSQLQHWSSFIRVLSKDNIHGTAKIELIENGNSKLFFHLKTNGALSLQSSIPFSDQEIQFAHMGLTYQFNSERQIRDSMTSFDQSLRTKFSALSSSSIERIKTFLKKVFTDFVDIDDRKQKGVFIIENDTSSINEKDNYDTINHGIDETKTFSNNSPFDPSLLHIEVSATSSSFQKIFAALILLFCLIEKTPSSPNSQVIDKYYLIDEPDALLEESLAVEFTRELISLTNQHNIKFVATALENAPIKTLFEEEEGEEEETEAENKQMKKIYNLSTTRK